jgi:hypothetical protein
LAEIDENQMNVCASKDHFSVKRAKGEKIYGTPAEKLRETAQAWLMHAGERRA